MPFKLTQDQEACIGCGACAAICPANWVLNGDKAEILGAKKEGKVFVKIVNEAGCNNDAANACPVKCIKVEQVQ
ncbi:MAG: ferredoxin [archaeon]